MGETAIMATTPEERTVMRVLSTLGRYPENPDGFDWANADACTVMEHVNERGLIVEVVVEALIDTGMYQKPHPRLTSDATAIVTALENGSEAIP